MAVLDKLDELIDRFFTAYQLFVEYLKLNPLLDCKDNNT